MESRLRSILVAAVLVLAPAAASAQTLADYDYENLSFRGIGLDWGYIWPSKVNSTPTYSLRIDLGYLGTWSADRQEHFDRLLLGPAADWREGRFAVAGPQYPDAGEWPRNVHHVAHLPPREHADFYSRQRFTLNLTRADMRRMGFSPSVRLFEAASCGTPVISDEWEGHLVLYFLAHPTKGLNGGIDVSYDTVAKDTGFRLFIGQSFNLFE